MYEELKKAAESCKDLLPLRYMESHGSLYIRNDCGIVFDVHQNRSFPDFMAHNKAYADLALAANPSAVLALIAENDRLQKSSDHWKVMHDAALDSAKAEAEIVGQLRVENEALRKDAERYRWLRDSSESIHQFYLSTPIWFTGVKFSKENVDSTIDAAMRKDTD